MRRHACLALVALVAVVCTAPALARKDKDQGVEPVFTLESELLARDPSIAGPLERVQSAPDDTVGWRHLGKALSAKGAFGDAVRALEQATESAPDDADAWTDLGAAHLRAGDTGAALSALKRAIKIEPFHALAYYNIGLAEQERGRFWAALDAFEYALRIDPSLADPTKNPEAAVNPALDYARLLSYLEAEGAAPSVYTPTR